MILLNAFLVFMKVGVLTVGGGLAMIPLLQEEILSRSWMTLDEFTHMISISQMTPGPIIINLATFVGFRLSGIPGAIACTIGVVLPSLLIVTLISSLIYKYRQHPVVVGIFSVVRPVVVGLVVGTAVKLSPSVFFLADKAAGSSKGILSYLSKMDWAGIFIFGCGFLLLYKTKLHPAKIMGIGALLGAVIFHIAG